MSFTAPSTQLQAITIIISTRTFKKVGEGGGVVAVAVVISQSAKAAPGLSGAKYDDDNMQRAWLCKKVKVQDSVKKVLFSAKALRNGN